MGPLAPLGAPATRHLTVDGTTEDGALYRFEMPDAWNGSLIVYAHGIIHPSAPIALPSTQDDFNTLRDALLARGFAVASSSFAQNGYAVRDAALKTHGLPALFTEHFTSPARTFLVGHSLGAVAALKVAENHPEDYTGALAMCGFAGGGAIEVNYLANARVLFDYFFPGVVPGSAFDVPEGLSFTACDALYQHVLARLLQGMFTPGKRTMQWAKMAGLPGISATEIVTSGMNVIGYSVGYTNDLLRRTRGHIPFDNSTTEYRGSANDADLNEKVLRFKSSRVAINYLCRNYTPTGRLEIPVLTLRTTRDPIVREEHDRAYAENVRAEGRAAFLVQQYVDRYGHCQLTPHETLDAFLALVRWTESGVTPAGGDVTRR